jgi:hypothetical protein
MNESFFKDFLDLLIKHDIKNPESMIRNASIKAEYRQLRKAGMKSHKAFEVLSEKYFTSAKNIEFIIYDGNKKQDQPPAKDNVAQ